MFFQGYHDDDQFNSHLFFTTGTNITKVLGIIRNSLTTFSASYRTTVTDVNNAENASRQYR